MNSDITLVSIDTKYKYETMHVLKKMMVLGNFHETILFSNNIADEKIRVVEIPDLVGKKEGHSYSYFCLRELPKYIETPFCLIVQHDGFIINPDMWSESFMEFDYIGAPWPDNFENRVGNGGFSLRSKKFLDTCVEVFADKLIAEHEDLLACVHHYKDFKDRGVKFAPPSTASDFSIEHITEYTTHMNPFGFHGTFTELGRNAIYENSQYLTL